MSQCAVSVPVWVVSWFMVDAWSTSSIVGCDIGAVQSSLTSRVVAVEYVGMKELMKNEKCEQHSPCSHLCCVAMYPHPTPRHAQ